MDHKIFDGLWVRAPDYYSRPWLDISSLWGMLALVMYKNAWVTGILKR